MPWIQILQVAKRAIYECLVKLLQRLKGLAIRHDLGEGVKLPRAFGRIARITRAGRGNR